MLTHTLQVESLPRRPTITEITNKSRQNKKKCEELKVNTKSV